MKLFNIKSPGVPPVEFDWGNPPRESIRIGGVLRGRVHVIIPVVGTGPEVRVMRTPRGIVLQRGDWNDNDGRCVAIINACGAYSRRSYDIYDATPGLNIIARGTYAFGAAGGVGGGPEVLAICSPGTEFRLNSKYDSHWYRWDGNQWYMESPAQRAARLATEALQRGEGEQL